MAAKPRNHQRGTQLALLGAALFASGIAIAGGTAPLESASVLRARATKLFRAKQFAAACPWFEAAARRQPGEPDLLADLALCQHRIGRDDLAQQTNLEAIQRASEPAERLDDARFARVRQHAYFNLSELEIERHPEPSFSSEPSCWQLEAARGCSNTLSACGVARASGGRTYRSETTTVRIAQTEEAAQFDEGEPDSSEPEFENLTAPSPDRPTFVDASGALDQIVDFSEEQLDYDCEWSCGGSSAVAEGVEKCQAAAQPSPTASADCERTVCAKAERSPWAAVKVELRNSDACFEAAAKVDGAYSCSIVYGNACTGLVGFVCSGHAGGKKETLSRVEEYRFQPPDAQVR